jgi:hypothetical protein
MENNIEIIAERKNKKNNMKSALTSFGVALAWFVFDLIWYLLDLKKDNPRAWNKVVFIISAVVLGLVTIYLLFEYSSFRTNKKIADKPLLSFDHKDSTFIFYDVYENKEKKFNKNDVIRIKINPDNDEARIVYKKNDKNKEIFIGYGSKMNEELINNKIDELKL